MSEGYVFFINGPFSQWHRCRFEFEGQRFNSAEQAMMYAKAMLFGDKKTAAAILAAKEPRKQKELGRLVKKFSADMWAAHRYDIVRRINQAKFSQDQDLRRQLLETGQRSFVEASPSDAIWGIGLNEADARAMPPEHWPGRNLLGRALTEVRDALREERSPS